MIMMADSKVSDENVVKSDEHEGNCVIDLCA